MSTVGLLQIVSASRHLANRAGLLIRNIFESGNLRIIDKSMDIQHELSGLNALKAKDPQTIADCAAQKLITQSLLNEFPKINVIGEEDENDKLLQINPIKPLLRLPSIYYNNNVTQNYFNNNDYDKILNNQLNQNDICVWVDPIDGTKEYTEGIKDAVTCLIGIAYKGNPIAGIINRPFSNQTIFGFVGIPSIFYENRKYDDQILNDMDTQFNMDDIEYEIESIDILTESDFDYRDMNRRVIACSRSHFDDKIMEYVNKCKPDKIERRGGAGGKVLMILEGYADCYIHYSRGTKKWDTCAPQALLNCVGGILTEPNGKLLDYSSNTQHRNMNGIVATWNKTLHKTFCMKSNL